MRRFALAWLLLLACCNREQPAEARPPPGEAWLSQEQIQAGQIQLASVEEQPVASEVAAPGRIAFDDSHVAPMVACGPVNCAGVG